MMRVITLTLGGLLALVAAVILLGLRGYTGSSVTPQERELCLTIFTLAGIIGAIGGDWVFRWMRARRREYRRQRGDYT